MRMASGQKEKMASDENIVGVGNENANASAHKNVHLYDENYVLELRPLTSSGWWLCCLLPAAYLVNCWQHQRALSFDYKLSAIVAFGLFLQSLVQIGRLNTTNGRFLILRAVPSTVTATMIFVCLHQNFIVSAIIGLTTKFTFNWLFFYVLLHMPRSFTFGEASIVVQGVTIFILNVFLKLSTITEHNPVTDIEKMSTILQVGLTGITFLVGICHFVAFFRGYTFYPALGFIAIAVILFPIGQDIALVALFEFIFTDLQRLCIVTIYMGLLGITMAAVSWHLSRNRTSNTRIRKIFHILIVLVFVPGLIYQCTFLFVASGVALALLILLELVRIMKLEPFADVLQRAVKSFVDEKDAGVVAMTPIYLLVGCSFPIWLHPCPCDLTDAAGFELVPLMAGVISVGLGDTAASVIGSKFGRIHWSKSIKTVEGTIAAIVVQALVLPLLIHFGFVQFNALFVAKYTAAIVINSLVETFTDQVDNVVLPLLTFIILSI